MSIDTSKRYWLRRIRPLAGQWNGEDIGPVLVEEPATIRRIIRPETPEYRQVAREAHSGTKLYTFAEHGENQPLPAPPAALLMRCGWLVPGSALLAAQPSSQTGWSIALAALCIAIGLLLCAHAGRLAALRALRDARITIRHRTWDRLLSAPGQRHAPHANWRMLCGEQAEIMRFRARMELRSWALTGSIALSAFLFAGDVAAASAALFTAIVICVAASLAERSGVRHEQRLQDAALATPQRTGLLKYGPWLAGYGLNARLRQRARQFCEGRAKSLQTIAIARDAARSIDLATYTLLPLAAYALSSPSSALATSMFALALGRAATGIGRACARILMARRLVARAERVIPGQGDCLAQKTELKTLEAVAVSHAYADGRALFGAVSFTLRRGQALALAGPSGIGKSSLIRLMMGLGEPKNGRLLLNGAALSGGHAASWRASIACVAQDEGGEPGTIGSVIGSAVPGASQDDVEAAARAACAHDDITSLPMGYMTLLIEGAMPRSLVARIAIARCFAARPEMMVLDETLSCLDTAIAARILQNARACSIAVVMVSHRTDVLALADQKVLLSVSAQAATASVE